MGKNKLRTVLEVLSLAIFIIGIIMLFLLPFIIRFMLGGYEVYGRSHYYAVLLALLECTDLLGIISFWQLKKILGNINKNKPFVQDNAKRIRRISVCCAVLAVAYGVSIFYLMSWFVVIIFVLFAVISLALRVCAELFSLAGKYSDENSLTI